MTSHVEELHSRWYFGSAGTYSGDNLRRWWGVAVGTIPLVDITPLPTVDVSPGPVEGPEGYTSKGWQGKKTSGAIFTSLGFIVAQ